LGHAQHDLTFRKQCDHDARRSDHCRVDCFAGRGGQIDISGSTSAQNVSSNNTGGGSHNTVDRGMVGTFYIKL
jgi:hypothetical protein